MRDWGLELGARSVWCAGSPPAARLAPCLKATRRSRALRSDPINKKTDGPKVTHVQHGRISSALAGPRSAGFSPLAKWMLET